MTEEAELIQALRQAQQVLAELINPNMAVPAGDVWMRCVMAESRARAVLAPTLSGEGG